MLIMAIQNRLESDPKLPRTTVGFGIVAIVLIGIVVVLLAHASGPFVSLTLSNANLNGVTVGVDTSAYGGHFIQFGAGPTPTPTPAPGGFVHPGVLLDTTQLNFVKAKIAAGAQPWTTAYNSLKGKSQASLSYSPAPIALVKCDGNGSADIGCTAEVNDAIAAYSDALIWYYSGNQAYANKSIQILNAWSSTLQDTVFDKNNYINGILQSGWSGTTFTRAAEIMRYSNAGWSSSDVTQFSNMLTRAFLPHTITAWPGGAGNWITLQADADIEFGVFTNNQSTYNAGVAMWKRELPALIYINSDGAAPEGVTGGATTVSGILADWHGATKFINGLEQETCRDNTHTLMALAAAVDGAETARIQGLNLYQDAGTQAETRLTASYELNAGYTLNYLAGKSQTNWVCNTAYNEAGAGYELGWEVAYNEYANRLGVAMPNTRALILKERPSPAALFMNWETLTSSTN
jgi:hypothetical protein